MFPLKDDIPSQTFPIVTIGVIVINCAVFFYEFSLGSELTAFLAENGFVPARFLDQHNRRWFDLQHFLPAATSLFLHGSPLHLLANMWMLWIFGDNVEDCMGHLRYLCFFMVCGLISVFGQAWAWPQSQIPLVGASGAISGVLGAYFITYPKARVMTLVPLFILFYLIELPAFLFLGFWFLVQFLQGSLSLVAAGEQGGGGIAWWAHIGGFGAGVVLVFLFRKRDWRRVARRRPIRVRRVRRN